MLALRSRRRSAWARVGIAILTRGRKETRSASPKAPSRTRCAKGGMTLQPPSSVNTRKVQITTNGHSKASQARSANSASQLRRTRLSKRFLSALASAASLGLVLEREGLAMIFKFLAQARLAPRLHHGNLGAQTGKIEALCGADRELRASRAGVRRQACPHRWAAASSRKPRSPRPAPPAPRAGCYIGRPAPRHRRPRS